MASIRCRSGETWPNTHTHASVADVRKCQGAVSGWKVTDAPKPVAVDTGQVASAYADKDPKNIYLNAKGINAQLAAFQPVTPLARTVAPGGTKPFVRVDPELEAKVPAGRYAVEGEDGTLKFYRVEKPAEGPWAGRTFVKVQAGDDWHPVRYAQARAGILRKIAKDVRAASIRYGLELGVCGVCGRTLTNADSIAKGIGPVCEGRL